MKLLPFIIGCFFLCAPEMSQASDGEPSEALLRSEYTHADLVIVATPQKACGGAASETVGDPKAKYMVEFTTFNPELKIEQVLKGDVAIGKNLVISYTTRKFVPPISTVTPSNHFSFDKGYEIGPDVGLPGSPAKGVRYVFFLEDRRKSKPDSHEYWGKEELFYGNYDYDFGMMVVTDTTLSLLKKVVAGQ